MYRVILFDLDGTLTESGEGITRSVQYALEKIGKPEEDREKLQVFVGPPLLEQFMNYACLDEETACRAVEYYRERYKKQGIFENELYPGVEQMLQGLREKGFRLAVASSKPEYFVTQILEYFHINQYFEQIVGSGLDGSRSSKAEVIEETLARLQMSDHRQDVLMVGDRKYDVLGAREAGLSCLAVSYGYGSVEELEAVEPLKIVDSTEEILDFFG